MLRAAVAAAVVVLCASGAEAANCTVSSTSVSFGTYNVFNATPNDSTGSVTLNCTGGAKSVAIGISRGGSSTFLPRRMAKGGEPLVYNLFLDAARTVVWGDGSPGTQYQVVDDPRNRSDVTMTIFGRMPPAQDVSAGTYADTVMVTVNY